MIATRRTPHLSLQARRCLILTTLTALLLIPALQAAVSGFFVTDLSAAGMVALALICGSRYYGGHTVRTHRPAIRAGVCVSLLAISLYELVTLSTDRVGMSATTHFAVIVTPLLLMMGLWNFTARQTQFSKPTTPPEMTTE